ncbi:MAG: flotillin-like protein FloA [Christensenellaceae bacterium]|jgi:uncharacterized protein YqfA (UPF0365 family)|nr:flotillin-like protein FloA [Christensenellaceae bacterium]
MLAATAADLWWLWVIIGVLLIVFIVFIIMVPIKIWFRALVSGAHMSMLRLVGMKLRKVNVKMIVEAYITSKKAGLTLDVNELETHFMAGGDVNKVVNALIAAHSARIALSIDTAKAIDLAGRDVLEAVKMSVSPRVVESPPVSAVARNGIELVVRMRITLKSNIAKLVGGAGEETVIARIGEGIVTTVGSAENHEEVLQNPDLISKTVFAKGLDTGTAFEVLSLDVADIDVGRNIGAGLQIERAEADKRIAQAEAEKRRSMGVAAEQEMKAETQKMTALKVAAEAELPKAIAEAFKNGQLGLFDYYRMRNLEADTDMRKSLSSTDKKTTTTSGFPPRG